MPVETASDLYGLPLDRFIPERAALAKTLRAEKRRDEAGEVAARRKPSVAAWAVNQLVRTQAKAVRALLQAGDELAQAQAGAATGKRTADAMRDASGRQREAIDALLQAAKGLLSSDGHPLTPSTLERVTDTLRAASIDETSRRQVQDGCLTQELRFAGLGIGDLALAAPSPPRHAERAAEAGRKAEAKADRDADAKADAERRAALKDARRAETEARRAAARADKALAAAQARREEAAAALEEAERLHATAARRAKEAEVERKQAARAVAKLADG